MSAAPHSLPRPDSYHLLLLTAQDAGQQLQWEAGSWASLVAQLVKNPPAMPETWVQSLGWEDPGKKRTATHSSILAWRVHGSQRVGLSDFQREAGASQVALVVKNLHANAREVRDTGSIPESGRSPGEGNGNPFTPVFLPRESHGQRSLAGYSPQCLKELDGTEHAH